MITTQAKLEKSVMYYCHDGCGVLGVPEIDEEVICVEETSFSMPTMKHYWAVHCPLCGKLSAEYI